MKRIKILKCYPFGLLNPLVLLIEGFKEYVGILGDKPGEPHGGIDYARKQGEDFISFEVFSMHDGYVFRGRSDSWGNFVKICKEIGDYRFETVYAHLKNIPKAFPILPKAGESKNKGMVIPAGRFLGRAGTSGDTKTNIQLHFELQIKNLKTKKRQKVDPYGVYNSYTSGKYPQPGQSLSGLKHFWTTDSPHFADKL